MNQEQAQAFDSVESVIEDIAAGKLVIVTDDENRENEGDLVMAASKATAETINMMIRHARGLICVPTVHHQLQRLGIHQMVAENRESHGTDFTVSVDAAEGISTGISAYDRARTITLIADPQGTPDSLVQPGHVFPLRARPGGVLQRAGHTEAAVDLATLAGLPPSGVICEILNDDGGLARFDDLVAFKKEFGLKMLSIAQLIEYRHKRDRLVHKQSEQSLSTKYGQFTLHSYISEMDDRRHYALTRGEVSTGITPVRVHGLNVLTDIFAAGVSEGDSTISKVLAYLGQQEVGAFILIQKAEGDLGSKSTVDKTPSSGESSTANMDFRDYGLGAQIMADLGLRKIKLITSRPRHIIGLDGFDIEVVGQISL